MLGILACQPVGAVQVNSAASDLVASYGRDHFTWLQQRHEITQRDADKPELCSPGAASTSSGCQVGPWVLLLQLHAPVQNLQHPC